MPYLIDGHNLIAHLPDLRLDDPDDEAKLVMKLRGFAAARGKRCIVIFDHGLPGGSSRLSTPSVEVIFASAAATNADRIIKERIRDVTDAPNWVVVSSDNEVLADARRHGMRPMRCDKFAVYLSGQARPGQDTHSNPYVPPKEIDAWMKEFGQARPDDPASASAPRLTPRMDQPGPSPEATRPGDPKPTKPAPRSRSKRGYRQEIEGYALADEDVAAFERAFGRAPGTQTEHKPTQTPPGAADQPPQHSDSSRKREANAGRKSTRRRRRQDATHQKGDPHLTDDEIDDWLEMFGEDDG